jgi:hypothetical protein
MVTIAIRKIYAMSRHLFIDRRNLAEITRSNQPFRHGSFGIALGIIWALGGDACSAGERIATEAYTSPYVPAYPLKTSANNR